MTSRLRQCGGSTRQGRRARVLPLGLAAPGLLDPFSFGVDLSEKRTMATETVRLLLSRMSEERGAGIALASQPHPVIWVDPCAGLPRLALDEAQRWLLALPICGVY